MTREFDILINKHRPMMLSYASALLRQSIDLAEDVVQESCIIAYKKLASYNPDAGSFPKWLRGIIRNKVLESQRKSARRALIEQSYVIKGMEEIYDLFDQASIDNGWSNKIEILHECVHNLNEKPRSIIIQFYHIGETLREIAMNRSSNIMAVGQVLSRARKEIRKCVTRKLTNY